MSRLKEINNWCINTFNESKESLDKMNHDSVMLAILIMKYAHRNQKRENGEDYENHPYRLFERFWKLYNPNELKLPPHLVIDGLLPFSGVQQVALLHDVIEDTDFTLNDVEEIYDECGFKDYFIKNIKDGLIKITHIKSMPYDEYINICLENPVSALVKMLDLQDNLEVLDLIKLSDKNYERNQNYLRYIYQINSKYHFIENAKTLRDILNICNQNNDEK